jgi:hypothetical protein
MVYFGSFQDLLGKDKATGLIKPKNEWVHTTNWDLVIFDEYHFGAWRDSAQELFEGEDELEAKKEVANEYGSALDTFGEILEELSGNENDFLPISTKAYLYLSGTPFKALATGEFIEEQSSTGHTPMNNVPNVTSQLRIQINGILMQHCQKCV